MLIELVTYVPLSITELLCLQCGDLLVSNNCLGNNVGLALIDVLKKGLSERGVAINSSYPTVAQMVNATARKMSSQQFNHFDYSHAGKEFSERLIFSLDLPSYDPSRSKLFSSCTIEDLKNMHISIPMTYDVYTCLLGILAQDLGEDGLECLTKGKSVYREKIDGNECFVFY